MRAIVQRVREASVSVDDETIGAIGAGLVILVGVTHDDSESAARFLAQKIATLRIFEDAAGKFSRSARAVGADVLVVSQFTLYADTRRGRRPSYLRAAPPEEAGPLYESFVEVLRRHGLRVECGVFRAMMEVELVNDGPVTILLDSERLF